MSVNNLFGFVEFFPLAATAPKFFGFSEFLAALALMILAWTIADVRYRFRIMTTPFPLQKLTFWVIAGVGISTLLTDLWRAEQWLVPKGNLITPAEWQALLGILFLLTFLAWTWYAFISPPIYGKMNANRYAKTLYHFILKGSPSELSVISDELNRSAKSLISYAPEKAERSNSHEQEEVQESTNTPPDVIGFADAILLLIADKRFCRSIVDSSSDTILYFFREISATKKYKISISTFAKNIVIEALANNNSFLYHETEGFNSGLIGYHKPLSQAMFSNYEMVEKIETMLEPGITTISEFNTERLRAYCRIVILTLQNYLDTKFPQHSFVLIMSLSHIEHTNHGLNKINGVANISWSDDTIQKLIATVDFIDKFVKVLDKKDVPKNTPLRLREKDHNNETIYDHIANLIYEVIHMSAYVQSPKDLCWSIQYISTWSQFFSNYRMNCPAGKFVKFKVRRLIYNEIIRMNDFPNFKGARILNYCLNVMGLTVSTVEFNSDSIALHKAIICWIRNNFAWLHSYNPEVSEACLANGITYDEKNHRLIKSIPKEGLRREPLNVYLEVEPPPTQKV